MYEALYTQHPRYHVHLDGILENQEFVLPAHLRERIERQETDSWAGEQVMAGLAALIVSFTIFKGALSDVVSPLEGQEHSWFQFLMLQADALVIGGLGLCVLAGSRLAATLLFFAFAITVALDSLELGRFDPSVLQLIATVIFGRAMVTSFGLHARRRDRF